MAEILEAQDKAAGKQQPSSTGSIQGASAAPAQLVSPFAAATGQPQPNGQLPSSTPQQPPQQQPTWVHDIFQGWLVSETRCLQCETITRREESFMDLSLEIDHNTSLTSCLKQFR